MVSSAGLGIRYAEQGGSDRTKLVKQWITRQRRHNERTDRYSGLEEQTK